MWFRGRSKYGNKKQVVDGFKFDSKKEAKRYEVLKLLQSSGKITGLERQPKYVLQEAFIRDGKKYRPITYVADFRYFDKDLGKVVVEDVKGWRTEVYRIKAKMFIHQLAPGVMFMEL
jgi:hypothetical protein